MSSRADTIDSNVLINNRLSDSFQRMLVGYFNENGILIFHPASTAAHYLKGAFITDLFGCLSLENLESAQKELGKQLIANIAIDLLGAFSVTPNLSYNIQNLIPQP